MADFSFKIEKHIGVIGTSRAGWTKELNVVSFNGAPAKFDIREWSPDHESMGKGVTMTKDEFEALVSLLIDDEKQDIEPLDEPEDF